MTRAHPLGRGRALLVVPIALVCLAIPPLMWWHEDGALIDDTRAWFGAGSDVGVPRVADVRCVPSRTGSNSSRGIGMTSWGCSVYLTPAPAEPMSDPFKTMPYDAAMTEYFRRTQAALAALNDPANRIPSKIERELAVDRTGERPALRRLSRDGQPPRFGLVWGIGELASRWTKTLLLSALFFGAGIGILYMARSIWRREVS